MFTPLHSVYSARRHRSKHNWQWSSSRHMKFTGAHSDQKLSLFKHQALVKWCCDLPRSKLSALDLALPGSILIKSHGTGLPIPTSFASFSSLLINPFFLSSLPTHSPSPPAITNYRWVLIAGEQLWLQTCNNGFKCISPMGRRLTAATCMQRCALLRTWGVPFKNYRVAWQCSVPTANCLYDDLEFIDEYLFSLVNSGNYEKWSIIDKIMDSS